MSNKLKRKVRSSKQERAVRNQQIMSMQEKRDYRDMVAHAYTKHTFESMMPIFLLWLIDNFHCKEPGCMKFVVWFNEMLEWIDNTPDALEQIAKEVEERTGGMRIVY